MKICHAHHVLLFSMPSDGAAQHIMQRVNLAVVAKAELPRILAHAKVRGWRWMRLLSSAGIPTTATIRRVGGRSPDAALTYPARRRK